MINSRKKFENPSSGNRKQSVWKIWGKYPLVFGAIAVLGIVAYPNDILLSHVIRSIGDLPGDIRRILALSELLAHGSGIAIMMVVIWQLVPHLRIHLPRVACCAFAAGLTADGFKLLIARKRPLVCHPGLTDSSETWLGVLPGLSKSAGQTTHYAAQSFPSAHTATAVGCAIALAWVFPRGKFLFYTIAVFAGLQRIVFLAHWPSDVLAGALIGIFMGACFTVPGTIGNSICDRIEWKLGLGRDLGVLANKRVNRVDASAAGSDPDETNVAA